MEPILNGKLIRVKHYNNTIRNNVGIQEKLTRNEEQIKQINKTNYLNELRLFLGMKRVLLILLIMEFGIKMPWKCMYEGATFS